MHVVARMMQSGLGGEAWFSTDAATVSALFQQLLAELARAGLPILLTLMLLGALASVIQTGFLFLPQRAAPDFARVSPLRGLQRIFSMAGVLRLGFGLIKVLVIFVVAGAVAYVRRAEIVSAAGFEVATLGYFLIDISLKTALWVGAALLVLALFDYAWQRFRHERDLRMTLQEVREEMKNLQGDPQVIARRRAVQRQLVASRISSTVPKADVVVTNPTELAVAIQYEPETMAAPVVVAKGAGVLAQRIRRLALEHNIPIVEKRELARLLYKEVEINHPVPNQTYAAVAEVLAYVYQLKGKTVPVTRS
jgi:flagellar biosynthetic protein FlhB